MRVSIELHLKKINFEEFIRFFPRIFWIEWKGNLKPTNEINIRWIHKMMNHLIDISSACAFKISRRRGLYGSTDAFASRLKRCWNDQFVERFFLEKDSVEGLWKPVHRDLSIVASLPPIECDLSWPLRRFCAIAEQNGWVHSFSLYKRPLDGVNAPTTKKILLRIHSTKVYFTSIIEAKNATRT